MRIAVALVMSLVAWSGVSCGHGGAASASPATTKEQHASPDRPTAKSRGTLGVSLDGEAIIQDVMPGSGAAKAGLQVGDAVVAIDDQPIDGSRKVVAILAAKAAGDKVRVAFVRDGKKQVVDLVLQEKPKDPKELYNLACAQARAGQSKEAIASLSQVVAMGYAAADRMKADENLASFARQPGVQGFAGQGASKNGRASFAGSYRPGKEIAGVKTLEGFPEDGYRYRLRMSPDASADKPNRLIVWLHPNGTSMNDTVESMAPMFLKHGYALLVFTQKDFRGWSVNDDLGTFAATLAAAGKTAGIDARKPILLGFSGGGQRALDLWQQKPDNYGGLVLDAAYPVKRLSDGRFVAMALGEGAGNQAIKTVPVLALVGLEDDGFEVWQHIEPNWRKAGVPLKVIYVPGKGHQWLFDDLRTRELEKWLVQVADGKLPGQRAEPGADKSDSTDRSESLQREFQDYSGARLVFSAGQLPPGKYFDKMPSLSHSEREKAAEICLKEAKKFPPGYLGQAGMKAIGVFAACVNKTKDGFHRYIADLGGYRYYGMWNRADAIATAYYSDEQLPLTFHHELFHQIQCTRNGVTDPKRYAPGQDAPIARPSRVKSPIRHRRSRPGIWPLLSGFRTATSCKTRLAVTRPRTPPKTKQELRDIL